jgi:F0F1-type ATP synthase assembly protein I
MQGLFDDKDDKTDQDDRTDDKKALEEPYVLSDYEPQSAGETARQTGLAWSAGIAFFGAIVFMLFLGWIVDLLLGSSPWGIVGGILLGAVIGFMQLFRISSQIFKQNDSTPAEHPLMSSPNDKPDRRDDFDRS